LKLIFTILVIVCFIADLSGQSDTSRNINDTLPGRFYLLQKVERDGITMPEVEIKEVTIMAGSSPARRRDYRKYERLIFNLKKVYPYSLMVREKLMKVNEDMKNISGERQRKEYMKNVEKEVFAEYEDDIRNMTISQGRLLIKLIDRETQNTSYDLIREYRGKVPAFFWQGIARIFGTNLKDEYDPYGEDVIIEFIIREVDAGRL
jgi:hypothetical protein